MNMRDTLRKIDEEMSETVIQQFAPKNRAPIPTAAMVPRRSPEEVAAELRGVFDDAAKATAPIPNALAVRANASAPPSFGEQAIAQLKASVEIASQDINHAIEMLVGMREALERDASELSNEIGQFTAISGAISRAFKEFTATATNGGSHVKETPKG